MTFYYAHQVVINLKTLTSYSITSTTFNLLLFFGDAGFGRLHMIRILKFRRVIPKSSKNVMSDEGLCFKDHWQLQ